MKVLFIYPSNDPSYPLQLGALSSFVKQKGHHTKLLTIIINGNLQEKHFDIIKKEITNFEPDFTAFSCYETSFPWIKEITIYIKTHWPNIRTLVGGYYPTLAPEDVISLPSIDIICLGEGEYPMEDLLKSSEINYQIKNMWFKKDKQIIRNPVRPLIENLDELPFPDREMLDYQTHLNLEKVGERTVKVMATRGCPYQCTYCGNKYFKSIYPNKEKYLRFRSPDSVVEELKYIKSTYIFDLVGFHDDNLTLSPEWLKKFSQLYKKEIATPFYCATRVEFCTDEVLEVLKEAGCYMLLIGLESGDENYRKNYMKRYMSNKNIMRAFQKARDHGLKTWSFTMVGLPFENRRMILKTLVLNWMCHPDFVMASIFYPFRGTELGDICYLNDWINFKKKEKVTSYAWESILNHPVLTQIEIQIAKYLNSLTSITRSFFWKIAFGRLKNFFTYHQRI